MYAIRSYYATVNMPVVTDTIVVKERIHLERYALGTIPLILMVDDADFVSANLNNFLWVTFTRANPSHDIHGVSAFVA